ncbi:uncharacterized protein [Palaemon carinicauda]|uniref:uncharacterized protein n=1 Tax=Palaemon carinicauda TaxID=392227 RepID=UPI0035B67710
MDRQRKYQMVQVAVAMCVIKETPPNITPREFAVNLQKVFSSKYPDLVEQVIHRTIKHENNDVDESIPSSISGETDEEIGIEGLEVSKGLHAMQTDLSPRKLPGTSSCSGARNLTRADNDSFEIELNDIECLIFNSKRLKATGEKGFTDECQDNMASHTTEPMRGQVGIKSNSVRRAVDSRFYPRAQKLNTCTSNHSDVYRKNLDADTDKIMLSDVPFCSSSFLRDAHGLEKRACDNATVLPFKSNPFSHSRLLFDYEKEKYGPENGLDISMSSYLSEFEKSGLIKRPSKVQESNKNGGSMLEILQNYFQSQEQNNKTVDPRDITFSCPSLKKPMENLHKSVNLDDCMGSLITIKEEIEKSLEGACFGIFPSWSNLHSNVKVLTCWVNKPETHAAHLDRIFLEFISTILTLLFQFDGGSSTEGTSVNTTIWWMILYEVKGVLTSICPTQNLWMSSGNLLVYALLNISESCVSVSDVVTDHLSEIAHTVAEVLKSIVEYATSSPEKSSKLKPDENNIQGMETASKTPPFMQRSNVTSSKVSDNASQSAPSSHDCISLPDNINLQKERLCPSVSSKSKEALNSIDSLENKIHSALQSLTSDDTLNGDDHNYMFLPHLGIDNSSSASKKDNHKSCFYGMQSCYSQKDIREHNNLNDSLSAKSALGLWRTKLHNVCLPSIKNVLPLLYLQIKEICKLTNKSISL